VRLPRMTTRRWMIATVVGALVSLVASNPHRRNGIIDKRVVIPVASAVAAVYGLAAMRRPLTTLLPLLAVWIATPQVDHPRPDVINVSAGGCFIGWFIGASAGWISRRLTGEEQAEPLPGSTGSGDAAGLADANPFERIW
jgi:hypothetical protein